MIVPVVTSSATTELARSFLPGRNPPKKSGLGDDVGRKTNPRASSIDIGPLAILLTLGCVGAVAAFSFLPNPTSRWGRTLSETHCPTSPICPLSCATSELAGVTRPPWRFVARARGDRYVWSTLYDLALWKAPPPFGAGP